MPRPRSVSEIPEKFPQTTSEPLGSQGRPEGASGVSPELSADGQAARGEAFADTYPGLEHAGGRGPYMPGRMGNPAGQQGFPRRPAWSPFPSQRNRYIGEPQRKFTGERKPKFDDKVATAASMPYDPNAKLERSKTTRNDLISEAFEMYHLLGSFPVDDHLKPAHPAIDRRRILLRQ